MRQLFFIISVLTLILIYSCTNYDITDPGPQPIHLEDVKHQPRLSVLGILRPDSVNGVSQSFIHTEFSFPINEFPDSAIISDADVKVITMEGAVPVDSTIFLYTDFGLYPNKEYRNRHFFPGTGIYQLICQKQGYPIVKAQTVLPSVPQIKKGTIKIENKKLKFEIIRDEQVGLYEVTLNGIGWLVKDRFLRPKQGNIFVEFPLSGVPVGEANIKIYAYENNLSEYFTMNLSFKPNIYQKEFSTVENGYGCFGALNIFEKKIQIQ